MTITVSTKSPPFRKSYFLAMGMLCACACPPRASAQTEEQANFVLRHLGSDAGSRARPAGPAKSAAGGDGSALAGPIWHSRSRITAADKGRHGQEAGSYQSKGDSARD